MITHDFKLFFVHIPKCAGRSVCDIFNQRFDHYTAAYLAKEYSQYWERYNKFTIVRNPYDRMVSLYIYLKDHRRHKSDRIMINERDQPTFKQWLIMNINNFNGMFNWNSAEGERGTDGDLGSPFWFSPQWARISTPELINPKIIVDHVFKIEEGMEKVEQYLQKITGIYAMMPHSNKSEYKDYRSFYDDELVEIASMFTPIKTDCDFFNYKF